MRTWRRIAGGVALGLVGLVLNLAAVEVLPGVHFLLGPVAVLLAAVLLGPVAGGLAGAISGVVTLGLWGHPWGWLNLTVEGLFVGALSRRLMPITADGLYWLLSPLYFALTYTLLAEIPAEATLVAGVKQAVNGVLAALVVQVGLLVPVFRRRLRGRLPPPVEDMPMRRAFASALTLGAVIPLLVMGGVEGRARHQTALAQVNTENEQLARAVAREIDLRLEHATYSATQLSRLLATHLASRGTLPAQGFLEDSLDSLVSYSPELIYAYVGSAEGVALAFSPRVDREGKPLAGRSFADMDYVHRAREARVAFVSDVVPGEGGAVGPLVVAVAPVRADGRYGGYVLASLDLPAMRTSARDRSRGIQQRVLVVDRQGGIVFDSSEEDTGRPRSIEGSALAAALVRAGVDGTGTYTHSTAVPRLLRDEALRLFRTVRVERMGWRVVVEQPNVFLQRQVQDAYARLLVTMGLAAVAAVLVSLMISRAIISPMQRVSEAAVRLASGDRQARAQEATEDAPHELRQLARTFDQMAAELASQLEAIERVSNEKDAFLSIASHELRTPITVVKTQLALLRRKVGPEQIERIELFERQIDRLTRLVNQLLDASQLGSGRLPLQRTRLNLAEVARRVSEPLVSASGRHTLQLELSAVEGELDELRIEQVLHNLVSNAIKYSPDGGPIELRVKQLSPSEAELTVADRGIGLGGEDKEQLFERFERGERKALTGIYGLGVGLYVSREIVRRHGGRISLHNREGGGTVATVVLPLGG
ncbi:MAG TPA: ATP-binding protein [Myxococcaceae bacterium]|nr:ATP-binding protein [Myxococcaceae bacterium]